MDGTPSPAAEPRTAPELISQLATDLATLVRKESELVRTELSEKAHTAGKAVGDIAAGGLLMVAALLVLLQALVIALSKVMDPLWASLLVLPRTRIVSGSVKAEGLATHRRIHRVRQQRIPRRRPDSLSHAIGQPNSQHLCRGLRHRRKRPNE